MSANQPTQHFASASLYVGDLHPDVTEAVLYEIFNTVANVASIRVCRDSTTRKSLGYAYVNYHTVTDAERALDTLNFTTIKDQPCRIMWCTRDPTLRRNGTGNVFVKNLDRSIDNKALADTFSLFGNILSCKVMTDSNGRSLGYGFVHYESEENARAAVERVDLMQIGSSKVVVTPFQSRKERTSLRDQYFTNLYVKQFPEEWTDDVLHSVFSEAGEVTSVCIKRDNKGRSFGFVNFKEVSEAKQAVIMFSGRRTTPTGLMTREEQRQVEKMEAEQEQKEKEANVDDASAVEENKEGKQKTGKQKDDSRYLYVQRFQNKSERQSLLKQEFETTNRRNDERFPGVNLYVKNLDETVDDPKLREIFEPFGPITSARVMVDDKGKSRCFGFVCFHSADDASRALTQMHSKHINGKPLYVGLAEKREHRMMRLQDRFRAPNVRQLPVQQMGPGIPPIQQPMVYSPMHPHPNAVNRTVMNPSFISWRPQQNHRFGPTNGMHPQMQPIYPQVGEPMLLPTAHMGGGSVMGGGGAVPGRPMLGKSNMGPAAISASTVSAASVQPSPMPPNPLQGNAAQAQGMVNPVHSSVPPQSDAQDKQVIGERLYPIIAKYRSDLAGKITGMMLEMDNAQLFSLLESEQLMKMKIDEALDCLGENRLRG